jgi:hypothetical protein
MGKQKKKQRKRKNELVLSPFGYFLLGKASGFNVSFSNVNTSNVPQLPSTFNIQSVPSTPIKSSLSPIISNIEPPVIQNTFNGMPPTPFSPHVPTFALPEPGSAAWQLEYNRLHNNYGTPAPPPPHPFSLKPIWPTPPPIGKIPPLKPIRSRNQTNFFIP